MSFRIHKDISDNTEDINSELFTRLGLTFVDDGLQENKGRLYTNKIPDSVSSKNYLFYQNETTISSIINQSAQRLYNNLNQIIIDDSIRTSTDLITYDNYVGFPIIRESNITRKGTVFDIVFVGELLLISPNQELEIEILLGNIEVLKQIIQLPNQNGITPFKFKLQQIVKEIGSAGIASIFSTGNFVTIDSQGKTNTYMFNNINNTTYETETSVNGCVKIKWISPEIGNTITIENVQAFANI